MRQHALKSAHIGIAMGERGTDVARESAALVLLDDDFASIVASVRLGRRIFDNIQKAIGYIFAIHVPIAGMSLIPVLFKWPLMLMPSHPVSGIDHRPGLLDHLRGRERRSERHESAAAQSQGTVVHRRAVSASSVLQGVGVLLVVLAMYAGVLATSGKAKAKRARWPTPR